jgi:hypothetical protein
VTDKKGRKKRDYYAAVMKTFPIPALHFFGGAGGGGDGERGCVTRIVMRGEFY